MPVISLTYKDVSPIATCDLDFQGLIDKKGDINVYDARTGKIKDLLGKEIKSQPDQQKLSEIFSKAYSSLYGKNFISSQDKSVVCPIIVLGDSHASVMLIEAIKQEDGTIKYKWESCDSSGYHFNKYFEGYNDIKSFYEGVDFQGNIGNCPIFALAAFKEFKNQKFKSLEEAHLKRNMIMLSVASEVSQTLDPFYNISTPSVKEVEQSFNSNDLDPGFCLIDYGNRKFVVNSNALNTYNEQSLLDDSRSRVIQLDSFLDKVSRKTYSQQSQSKEPEWYRKNNNSGKVEKISEPQDFFNLSKRGINSSLFKKTLGSIHSGNHTGLYSNKVSLINSIDDNLGKNNKKSKSQLLKNHQPLEQTSLKPKAKEMEDISYYWRNKINKKDRQLGSSKIELQL